MISLQDSAVETMAAEIHEYLRRRSGVSLVELSRDIEGFSGDDVWGSTENNILMWMGMSPTAIAAMTLLLRDEKIEGAPSNLMVYAFDGGVLDLPIAKSLTRKYAKPHWYPLAFAGNSEAA